MHLVLAVNPVLAILGQIGMIIICLYSFIFIILAVAFNLGTAFGLAWVREKIFIVETLRPVVDTVNKATENAMQGIPAAEDENKIVRVLTEVPTRVKTFDTQIERNADRVAHAVIEFRARTVQAKTIAMSFFLPGLMKRE